LRRSAKEARRLEALARWRARARGARAKLRSVESIEQFAERCERIPTQTAQRFGGRKDRSSSEK